MAVRPAGADDATVCEWEDALGSLVVGSGDRADDGRVVGRRTPLRASEPARPSPIAARRASRRARSGPRRREACGRQVDAQHALQVHIPGAWVTERSVTTRFERRRDAEGEAEASPARRKLDGGGPLSRPEQSGWSVGHDEPCRWNVGDEAVVVTIVVRVWSAAIRVRPPLNGRRRAGQPDDEGSGWPRCRTVDGGESWVTVMIALWCARRRDARLRLRGSRVRRRGA